jgi:isoquinoline 1-oxidoreductase alpha subunit
MFSLNINGRKFDVEAEPDVPLLWIIREKLELTGTKYGCGMGLCGACTVLMDGKAERSCQIMVKDAVGKNITTIEDISDTNPVKKAWIEDDVPQCGYCQPGQIMSAVALLADKAAPSDQDIDNAMSGNICRCGTYQRIRSAIHRASSQGRGGKS